MFLHCQNTVLFVVYYSFIFVITTNVKKALYWSFRIKTKTYRHAGVVVRIKRNPLFTKTKKEKKNVAGYRVNKEICASGFVSEVRELASAIVFLSAHHAGSPRAKRNTTPSVPANGKDIPLLDILGILGFLHIYVLFMYSALGRGMRPW